VCKSGHLEKVERWITFAYKGFPERSGREETALLLGPLELGKCIARN
jgi:hypothetical protein